MQQKVYLFVTSPVQGFTERKIQLVPFFILFDFNKKQERKKASKKERKKERKNKGQKKEKER